MIQLTLLTINPIMDVTLILFISLVKKQKSPGLDGLPAEFYQVFVDPLSITLEKLYNICFTNDQRNESMYEGIISLLYKGKGERNERSS